MNKICTTIEQSKKLIELGIDVNTADMFWLTTNKTRLHVLAEEEDLEKYSRWDCMPAWSLSALMDLMPNVNGHYPELCRGKQTGQYYMWIEDTFDTQMFDDPIDAAMEMICWLKENNKI